MHNHITTGASQKNLTDPTKVQSSVIDLLRFPLIIMVLFIHMNPIVTNLIDADFSLISWHGTYNFFGILLSNVIMHIAVPTFYFISGFLFFINFMDWSWDEYKQKMRSRVKTLLIPYILWNAIPFLIWVFAMVVKGNPIEEVQSFITEKSWHIFYDCKEWGTTRINWFGDSLKMTAPYNVSLWFLRDLIVVSVFTPIIYYLIKKLRVFFICVLFLAYISRVWTLLPGFHITAFFYFSTGAYFALNKMNVVQFAKKYKTIFIPTCLMLLVVTTIFDGLNTVIGQNIHPLFVCTGVVTAFYVASICVTKLNLRPNKLLVSSCFFIYAIHGVAFPLIGPPLSFTSNVLHKIIPGNTDIEEVVCYFASPFITAALCIVLLMVGRKLFPKLTLYFSGNK